MLHSSNMEKHASIDALRLLLSCRMPQGFSASGEGGGYHNLWSRDSMIISLAVLELNNQELTACTRTSLLSLRDHQTELGLIPNKIDFLDKKRVNFRAYGDGCAWYALIIARYAKKYPDDPENDSLLSSALLALSWLRHQDHDQSGLVAIQEAACWMDLFPVRGKSLYINVLRYWATSELAETLAVFGNDAEAEFLKREAIEIKSSLHKRMWYEPDKNLAEIIHDSFSTSAYNEQGFDSLGRKLLLPEKTILTDSSYFLPYITFRDFGEWFDTLGNLLAILSKVADEHQSRAILSFIEDKKLAQPYPAQAIYPVIEEGSEEWRYYFRFADLNLPHHYHNGGIWPMIGGFYVLALIATGEIAKAEQNFNTLTQSVTRGAEQKTCAFNEYLHGKTGEPMGMKDQAWSASTYLLADTVLKNYRNENTT